MVLMYVMFRKRFCPDVLKSIDGEELIETIFNVMSHDGLPYWLEFKNDETIHKYYHMLFPDLFDTFHTTGWQKHALLCYGETRV